MGDYFEHKRKVEGVAALEAEGKIADSMDVRLALIAKMHAGEMTLAEVQAELAKIKRGAKRAGKITRGQGYRGS